jgi:hypothetical protein
LRFAHADKEARAFRTAYGLPVSLDGKDEPFSGLVIARAWAALPKLGLESLAAIEARFEKLIGWTPDEVRRFVVGDVPPENLPWRPGPLVEALLVVSLDQLKRYAFAMERLKAGLDWPAISKEWDRTQAPAKPYGRGVGYKRFWNDVDRTRKKLARRSAARRAAETLYPLIRAGLREAAARVAQTLGAPPQE